MKHRAGFVSIIGSPNVGKSTLTNALMGEKLSIITSKSQTTRHRILGIISGDAFQIVLSDTPGIIKPAYELQRAMMGFVKNALKDADILVYMVSVGEEKIKNEALLIKLRNITIPTLVLVNKIDEHAQKEAQKTVDFWKAQLPNAEVFAISALRKFGTDALLATLIEKLPESPAYYPKDQLTDKPERFFVGEAIREKILKHYKKEIPYCVEVVTESFVEEADIIKIAATILVTRESQKGIIIGHQGKGLTRIGSEARKDLEAFFGKKIFLKIFVKVDKNWRDNPKKLKGFGYDH